VPFLAALLSLQTAAPNEAELPGGYGWALLQAAISLLGVCVLAWLVLRWASKRGYGVGKRGGRMEVLERLPLDPRRSLHLVRVGDKALVIGTGDGAPTVLSEMPLSDLPEPEAPEKKKSFGDVLGAMRPSKDD
jgi:flagellar protein FliO/FliZ